jgi:hypothetical protein
MSPEKNTCENICDFHREHDLIINQHETALKEGKEEIKSMNRDIERIDTRGRILMWFLTLTFLTICSVSGYGVIQINHFKDIYQNDIVRYTTTIEGLRKDLDNIMKYMPSYKFKLD